MRNFSRGSPKKHSCEIIEKSVQQCQRRSLLKQKLPRMHVDFYGKSAPLMAFEGLMNRWMNEQTEENLDNLHLYLTSYQIFTKFIILIEEYELFKYFNIKVMTQKLKVCFVDLKVMGMGNDNLWHFSYFCFNT